MITGIQIRADQLRLGWAPHHLLRRAKVPISVVERAERSSGEPVITVSQMNALVQALQAAEIDLSSASEGDESQT